MSPFYRPRHAKPPRWAAIADWLQRQLDKYFWLQSSRPVWS